MESLIKNSCHLLYRRKVFALTIVAGFILICTVILRKNSFAEEISVYQRENIFEYEDLEKFVRYTETATREKPNYAVAKFFKLESQLKERLRTATDKKMILIWIPMFGRMDRIQIDQENCGNCEVTYDRNKVSDEKTGAVLFHFVGIDKSDMPKIRNPDHLYIFWAVESSATIKIFGARTLEMENSLEFNDTMTYRRDSGFYQHYDLQDDIMKIVKSHGLSIDELLRQKDKMAVSVVSNCGATSGAQMRMLKLKEIRSLGFPLDGFGTCLSVARDFENHRTTNSEQFHNAIRKYKFYFSFENSFHCKDYITEKFFYNALGSLAVPVVWGATKDDYNAVAPPGSFIFADDFSSMKELTYYLKYLDSNDTAYKQYFRWVTMKPEEMPQYGRTKSYCQICRALHGINIDDIYSPKFNESDPLRPLFTDGVAPRRLNDLIEWIFGEDNEECFT